MVATIVFEPAKPPAGLKVATLCAAELAIEKFVAVDGTPFNDQENVRLSLLASVALAVKLRLPLTPMVDPLAAGDCEAQAGGVFLFTVQV